MAWAGPDGPALSQNEGPGPTDIRLGRAIKAYLCPRGPDKMGDGLHLKMYILLEEFWTKFSVVLW